MIRDLVRSNRRVATLGTPLNDGPFGNWIIEGMSVTNLSGRSL